MEPTQKNWYNYLALALFQTNDIKGAEKAFRKCIELDPMNAEGLLGLSKVQIKQGKDAEGRKTAAKAKEVSETGLSKALEEGATYLKAGEKNKAFKTLLMALTLNEDEAVLNQLQLLSLQEQINLRKKPFQEKEVIEMLK